MSGKHMTTAGFRGVSGQTKKKKKKKRQKQGKTVQNLDENAKYGLKLFLKNEILVLGKKSKRRKSAEKRNCHTP